MPARFSFCWVFVSLSTCTALQQGVRRELTASLSFEWTEAPTNLVDTQLEPKDIAPDGTGGVYVAGHFRQSSTLASGSVATFGSTSLTPTSRPKSYTYSVSGESAFVVRVSSAGTYEWAIKANGTGKVEAHCIAPDGAGGAYVAGRFAGTAAFGTTTLTAIEGNASPYYTEAFVFRVSSAGAIQWAVKLKTGSSEVVVYDIASDGTGGALVAGTFEGSVTFGTTVLGGNQQNSDQKSAFALRLSDSGAVDWAAQATGTEVYASVIGWAIVSDGAGGAICTGMFDDHNYAGEVITFGSFSLAGGAGKSVFVFRVASGGAIQWATKAAIQDNSGYGARPTDITPDGAGGAYVTGLFKGSNVVFGSTTLSAESDAAYGNLFVMHVSAVGVILWARQGSGTAGSIGQGIMYDPTGDAVLVAGTFVGANSMTATTNATFGTTTFGANYESKAFVLRVSGAGGNMQATKSDVYWATGEAIVADNAGGAFAVMSSSYDDTQGSPAMTMRVVRIASTSLPSPPALPPPTAPAPLVTADEAKPLCAGPTELCFLDALCLTPGLDALGGLGCNAGGQGQQYRFCGFGPFIACPGPPKWIVAITSIVAGAVEAFDAPAYRANLRSLLPPLVNNDVQIVLNVTAASVRVEAGIVLRAAQDASTTSTALAAMDAASLSTGLGVTVTEVEHVSGPLTFAFATALPPPPPAMVVVEGGGSVSVKAGGILTIGGGAQV